PPQVGPDGDAPARTRRGEPGSEAPPRGPEGSTTVPSWARYLRRSHLPCSSGVRTVAKQSISKVLGGEFNVGDRVEVAGWVRTRRDSKAGLSFIHLSDGSCFDALQLVAPNTLPNYDSEITKLTTGC